MLRIGKSDVEDVEDVEAAAVAEAVSSGGAAGKTEVWVMVLVAFCFSSAVQFAVTSLQIQSKTFPPLFHLLSLALLLGFSFLLFAELVKPKSRRSSEILRRLAVVCLVSSFYVAIAIPFPLYFKIISLLLFLVVFSGIVVYGICGY